MRELTETSILEVLAKSAVLEVFSLKSVILEVLEAMCVHPESAQ